MYAVNKRSRAMYFQLNHVYFIVSHSFTVLLILLIDFI